MLAIRVGHPELRLTPHKLSLGFLLEAHVNPTLYNLQEEVKVELVLFLVSSLASSAPWPEPSLAALTTRLQQLPHPASEVLPTILRRRLLDIQSMDALYDVVARISSLEVPAISAAVASTSLFHSFRVAVSLSWMRGGMEGLHHLMQDLMQYLCHEASPPLSPPTQGSRGNPSPSQLSHSEQQDIILAVGAQRRLAELLHLSEVEKVLSELALAVRLHGANSACTLQAAATALPLCVKAKLWKEAENCRTILQSGGNDNPHPLQHLQHLPVHVIAEDYPAERWVAAEIGEASWNELQLLGNSEWSADCAGLSSTSEALQSLVHCYGDIPVASFTSLSDLERALITGSSRAGKLEAMAMEKCRERYNVLRGSDTVPVASSSPSAAGRILYPWAGMACPTQAAALILPFQGMQPHPASPQIATRLTELLLRCYLRILQLPAPSNSSAGSSQRNHSHSRLSRQNTQAWQEECQLLEALHGRGILAISDGWKAFWHLTQGIADLKMEAWHRGQEHLQTCRELCLHRPSWEGDTMLAEAYYWNAMAAHVQGHWEECETWAELAMEKQKYLTLTV